METLPSDMPLPTVHHAWVAVANLVTPEQAALSALDFTHDVLAAARRLNETDGQNLHDAIEMVRHSDPVLADKLVEMGNIIGHTIVAGVNLSNIIALHNQNLGAFKQKYCPCDHCRVDREKAAKRK